MPKTYPKAPAFTLPDHAGNAVSLKALRGRNVVLYFYPKDDTTGCTLEACEFRSLMPRFRKGNAVVLGISPDPVASHAKFKRKFRLNFPLLADVDHAVCEAYGVWKEKSMYGRKYMGVERSTFVIGPTGKILLEMRKVTPAGHADEVAAALAALPRHIPG